MSEDVFHSPGTTEPSPSSLSSTPLCPLSLSSSSSLCSGLGDVFRFDRPFCTSFDTNTPPPLPPKPTHLPDHHGPDDTVRNWRPSLLPRRTSLSGLEHFRRGPPQDHHRAGSMWVVDHSQHCRDTDVVVSFISGHRTPPTGRCPTGRCPQDAAPQDAAPQDAAHRTLPHRTLPTGRCPTGRCPTGRCPQDAAPQDTAPQDAAPQDAVGWIVLDEFDFSGKGLWNNRLSLNLANTHLVNTQPRFDKFNKPTIKQKPFLPKDNIIIKAILLYVRLGDLETPLVEICNCKQSAYLFSVVVKPIMLPIAVPESQSEDSYVPMASPPVSSSDVGSDGYIPMSPSMLTNGKALSPLPPVPDVEPPPVNRKLKPRIRVRPPPLDLRGLSTIREFPIHHPLTRTMTEPRKIRRSGDMWGPNSRRRHVGPKLWAMTRGTQTLGEDMWGPNSGRRHMGPKLWAKTHGAQTLGDDTWGPNSGR
ncbi:hypothetical protein NFI96_002294 [Prochilodus magdalenae]|nr:hypothetical protein NFI96_002294 [Prochilodus magdalenae]